MTLGTSSRNSERAEGAVSIEQIKNRARTRKLRTVQSLAERMQVAPDGSRVFIRFNRSQRLQHQVLTVSMAALSVTGLLQTFSHFLVVRWIIQVLGDVDTLRTIHHLASIALALLSFYHVWQVLVMWFVKRELGGMWPSIRDFRDLGQMVMYNIGLAQKRPESDRFSIEEKLEYWAMLWGTPLMGITGMFMWFPIAVTSVFPGVVVPVAKAIHKWEAILATLAILIWHMYHTVIKERNRSIFTGTMTEKEMHHTHPLEYRRILAAHKYLQKMGYENSSAGRKNQINK
ncbi:MAG: hypothetical protein GY832_23910 [Chloroflexi bacterium]|nr:hypothetical protein [Chloroflexota bacterium]